MQSFAPSDVKICTEGPWLFDENNGVSIDNSHILVLLHPFDRTADVTAKNRNEIMHLKCKKIAPRKCKIIIKFSAPEWPRLTATAIPHSPEYSNSKFRCTLKFLTLWPNCYSRSLPCEGFWFGPCHVHCCSIDLRFWCQHLA